MWTRAFDQLPWATVAEAARRIEELGYGTLWFVETPAGRDAPTQAALLLSATARIVVAPGVANIYRHHPVPLAQAERTLTEAYPGRFALGLGVGAQRLVEARGGTWGPPVQTMRSHLDAMDAALPGVPGERVLAALGPRMLGLAAERTWGAFPYFMPVEHTTYARDLVGPDALLAVHQCVVLDDDREAARKVARAVVGGWLPHLDLVPTRPRLLRELCGFDDQDFAGSGSDRLVDALVAAGDADVVAERVRAQFAAGADHVCIEVVTADGSPGLDELALLADVFTKRWG